MNANDRDLLLSRVVDREADADDWERLTTAAEGDPTLWRALGELLRDDGLLRLGLERELAPVPAVEAPAAVTAGWTPSWRALTGWAAAVLLGLAWWFDRAPRSALPVGSEPAVVALQPTTTRGVPAAAVETPMSVAGPAVTGRDAAAGAGEVASATGLEGASREVLGELSRELLEVRPLPDGAGFEVLSVRRVLEREHVHEVYHLGRDELGVPRPVPVPAASLSVSEVL